MKKCIEYIKQHKLQSGIIAILVASIAFWIWDFLDPPMFWQTEALENKRAIMRYVDRKYPGAKIVSQSYESTKFWGDLSCDGIVFEYNDIEFTVAARFGKVDGDDYDECKAKKYLDENFLLPFFEEKNVSPYYYQSIPGDSDDLASYDGVYRLDILQKDLPSNFTPNKSDWFYDFYLYCIENCEIERFEVTLRYVLDNGHSYSLYFKRTSNFYSTPEEFYAAFRYQ